MMQRQATLRLVRFAVLLAGLIMLGFALRHDLIEWSLRQGDARLRAGDTAGAEAAMQRTLALGGDIAPLAYNLGVSRYRKGDYAGARQRFAAALVGAPRQMAAAIHFNLGNSTFRQAEGLAERDPQAAGQHLRTALADYGQALALAPGDADAMNNRGLAQTRLQALAAGKDPHDAGPRAPDRKQQDAAARGERARSDRPQAGNTPGKADSGKDDILPPGNNRRDLTQTEAERLLNEARGREKPAGPLHAGGQNGAMARPERDW